MKKLDEMNLIGSCWNRAKTLEWIFVLLGRDVAAPRTIREWCRLRCIFGKNTPKDEQITEALACADAMEAELGGALPEKDVPIERRPGYTEVASSDSTLAKDLSALMRRHQMLGGVLVAFSSSHVDACSSGGTDEFGATMDKLASRLLREISDGNYDPETL